LRFFKETNPKQSKLRIFYFKLIHNKLPTTTKMKTRNYKKKVLNTKCVFGCEAEETTEHILKCKRNPEAINDMGIIEVLKSIDSSIEWKRNNDGTITQLKKEENTKENWK